MQMFLRRYIAHLLLAIVLLVLAGCGGAPETHQSDTGDGEQVAAPPTVDPSDPPADEEAPAENEEAPAEEAPAEEVPATDEEVPAEEVPATDEEVPATDEEAPAEDEEPPLEEQAEPGELPFVDPVFVEGDLTITGSTIVFPMVDRLVGEFMDEGYGSIADIANDGTDAGIAGFCAGEIDIAMASRPINDEESTICQDSGLEPLEFIIGHDALVIVVNTDNDAVSDITMDELTQLFSGAATWADVNPDWPDEDIARVVPAETSDAVSVFAEAALGGDVAGLTGASNIQMVENPVEVLDGVEGTPTAIGFLSYTDYILEEDRVKLVTIDGVEPDLGPVLSNQYPLTSPLLLYTSPSLMQEKAQVSGFINYALLTINSIVFDQGYFPPTEDELNHEKQKWLTVNEM